MMKIVAAVCCALLSACATYTLTLIPKEGNIVYGEAHQGDKSVVITVDGVIYTGQYTYVQQGFTSSNFGFGSSYSGRYSAWGNTFSGGFGVQSQGEGRAYAKSSDGKIIICKFTFSNQNSQGFGGCELSGKVYDLQINTASFKGGQ